MTSANLPIGSTIGGKYRLLRLLGEGGMGAVFEAQNQLTLKRVAIKVMHPSLAADGQAAARMMREAQTSSRVRHPNVVDVYDAGHEGDTVYLVMEYLEGESLGQAVKRGSMQAHDAIALLVDAMRGVAAAHRVGVIHRDIKPDNIFLAHEGEHPRPVPKVLDFGVSKLIDDSSLRLTRTDVTIGTPLYMSYEQLSGQREGIDGRADVYAFGVILYELLTGRPPHQANTLAQLAMLIATVDPPSTKELRPEIPDGLDDIVRHATAKYRDHRTANLETLMRELAPYTVPGGFPEPFEIATPVSPGHQPTTQPEAQDGQTVELPDTSERLSAPAAVTAPSLPAQRRTKRGALVGVSVGGLLGLAILLSQLSTSEAPRGPSPLPATPRTAAPETADDDTPPLTPPTQVTALGQASHLPLGVADAHVLLDEQDAAIAPPPAARLKPRRPTLPLAPTEPARAAPIVEPRVAPEPEVTPAESEPAKSEKVFRAGKPKRNEF